jgi:hypothetical protein
MTRGYTEGLARSGRLKLSEAVCTVSGMVQVLGGFPERDMDLLDALDAAARALGQDSCYRYLGRYHFSIGGGWSVALSAESAGRLRVEACRLCRPVHTMWVLPHRLDRLAGLVRRMSSEVAAEPV